jgi:acyl carrier protein phosphodiesterase
VAEFAPVAGDQAAAEPFSLNFLLHLYLCPPDEAIRLGSLMGDFVKGRIDQRLPAGIRQGLELHRRQDTFAQHSPHFLASRQRIAPAFGICRGIMVDIFYDHLLASQWRQFSDCPLATFAEEIYALLRSHHDQLPARMQETAKRMIAHDWLVSYAEPQVVDTVLRRIAERLRRPTPLAEGYPELLRNYEGFREDFEGFMAEAEREFR